MVIKHTNPQTKKRVTRTIKEQLYKMRCDYFFIYFQYRILDHKLCMVLKFGHISKKIQYT